MAKEQDESTKYIRSLRDPVKRNFATAYVLWARSGRSGPGPVRGALSPTDAKTVTTNLDSLI